MSGLNLKNELLEATSFEHFKERIRSSIRKEEYHANDWVDGIDLLREAHKTDLVYGTLEQCTNDKEQLATCKEILNSLDNLYCLNDKKRTESIHRIQSAIWEKVTSLQLAHQLIDEATIEDEEGYKIEFQVEKILDKEKNRHSLRFLVDTLSNYEFSLEIHLPVLVEMYIKASAVENKAISVWSNLQTSKYIENKNALYKRYLVEFPFDKEVLVKGHIYLFSTMIVDELVNEICLLYMAYENQTLGEADEKRLIELLYTLAITERFGLSYKNYIKLTE